MINNQKKFQPDITREEELKLQRCEDLFLIGQLRDESATFITSNNTITVYFNALCDEPEPLNELNKKLRRDRMEQTSDNYIAFDYKQSSSVLPDFYDKTEYDMDGRAKELTDFYIDKLIIFNPKYTFNYNNGKWFKNMDIIKVIDTKGEEQLDTHYMMIPKYSGNPISFEEALKSGEYFDLNDYDNVINKAPEYILCGSYAYRSREDEENVFEKSDTSSFRWRCKNFDFIEKIDYTKVLDDYKSKMIRASDNITFIESNLNSNIILCKNIELLESEKQDDITPVKKDNSNVRLEDESIETNNDNGESEFVNGLYNLTRKNGLQYKYDDLVNFHTCLKTNPLVILSGMSGTGKSRLAMNYAKMLNLSEDNGTLLFMPISPSYTEPSDVLGYLNSMDHTYIPSETGLVQFLLHAKDNPEKMHMVIFDEMNLSQVEYWFSPFISLLEKDPEEQILRLYDEDAEVKNVDMYPAKVKIGENILFVGTVNVDDTTKNFSDRLLDRTFVISLSKVKFCDFYNEYKKIGSTESYDLSNAKCKDVSQFKSWTKSKGQKYMEAFNGHQEELEFFDELDTLIKKYIPSGGISHRVMKNIGNYILNVPTGVENEIDSKLIFDMVANQTVLTKIRGTESQLQNLLGEIDENNKLVNSELIELLNKYSQISEFVNVKQNLLNKAEELRINGFIN